MGMAVAPKDMWKWMAGAVAALLAVGGLLVVGCAKESSGAPSAGKPGEAPRAPVSVARAMQKDVPVEVHVIGTVEPYSVVTVKSRVAGQILKVAFRQGQDVKKGDLLFQIDKRPFEAALSLARANLLRDIALARNAREEAQFQTDIFKRNAGTQRELDKAIAAAEAAEAQVEADKAAVRTAEIQLDYCTITSPLEGRTGDLLIHEGSVVKGDDTALVTINQVAPIYVSFSVPEKHLPQIRRHMATSEQPLTVDVTVPQDQVTAGRGPDERGALSFVDNQVDTSTGMIALKGAFANQSHTLWPGQFVNVALILTSIPNAVIVPTEAIQTGQQGRFLFVAKADNTVESRPVTVGVGWNDQTVIEKGLAAGEAVVTDGQLRLVNGSKISIKNGPTSQPDPLAVARSE